MIDQRDRLIDHVMRGTLSPDEAETEAQRLELSPLACEPQRDDFDPIKETQWSLPMAVAWLAYRTPGAVVEWWDKFREECWYWQPRRWQVGRDGPIHDGWFLEQRRSASLSLMEIADGLAERPDCDPDYSLTFPEAREALWTALQTDCFRASAIDHETGRRVQILPLDWQQLRCVEVDERDELRSEPSGAAYSNVLLPSASLLGLWPQPPTGAMRTARLPKTISPKGDGYIPLYCVAQWIATEGGTRKFDPLDVDNWKLAYAELLAALASEKALVLGTRDGEREPIPPFHFAACEVDYPYGISSMRLILGEELYLQSYPYLDETHWRGGFHDALMNRWGKRWSKLIVRKSDVLELWPFNLSEPLKTGAPGRPTSMHLIIGELEDRAKKDKLEATVKSQAEALAEWLGKTHPSHPQTKPKTVENNIRSRYRALRAAPK